MNQILGSERHNLILQKGEGSAKPREKQHFAVIATILCVFSTMTGS